MDKIESSKYYDYDQFDSESSDVESTEESSIESNNVKSFRSYNESNNDDGYNKTLSEEFTKGDDYNEFRKHYTNEIKQLLLDNDGRFVMTHQLAGVIITDIITMIEKRGYSIVKK